MKKKKLIIILLSLGVIAIALSTIIFLNKDRTPRIFEIKGTEEIINGKEEVIIEKYYMVENNPDNIEDLQNIVQKYYKTNYKKIESFDKKTKKTIFYDLYFFRSRKGLLKKRIQNIKFRDEDKLDHNKDDYIAKISYSDLDNEKYFLVLKRSNKHKNYGEVIKEKEFVKMIKTATILKKEKTNENNFSYWNLYNFNYVN